MNPVTHGLTPVVSIRTLRETEFHFLHGVTPEGLRGNGMNIFDVLPMNIF